MDNWFTVEQIDSDTFAVSEYKHWEETHCYLLCGEKSLSRPIPTTAWAALYQEAGSRFFKK